MPRITNSNRVRRTPHRQPRRHVAGTRDRQILSEPVGGLDSRFCEIMDAAPVMIWVSGKDKLCVWFNRPWLAFTGRRMAQELGNGWAEGVHRDDFDRCLETYVSHFDSQKEFRMQYRLRNREGAYRWIEDIGIPRYARDGTFLGYIGSGTDIHELRETQSELRDRVLEVMHLNRIATAGALSVSIAHELTQPLTAIQANTDTAKSLLQSDSVDREMLKEILDDIGRSNRRAATIIQRLRLFMRRRSGIADQQFDLNESIADAMKLVDNEATARGIELVAQRVEQPLPVRADKILLEQVLLNLVMNGMDALANSAMEERRIVIRTELTGASQVTVSVIDSGLGIPEEKIERVFDTFYTTKPQGTGLGLSITRAIIEAYGGKIWAETRPKGGAVFHFTLPLAERHLRPRSQAQEPYLA